MSKDIGKWSEGKLNLSEQAHVQIFRGHVNFHRDRGHHWDVQYVGNIAMGDGCEVRAVNLMALAYDENRLPLTKAEAEALAVVTG